jgi:hypothetical protein
VTDAINPNHPVMKEIENQWYKLCAILIHKSGETSIEITPADIQALSDMFGGEAPAIIADARGGAFKLTLMPISEGIKLGTMEGGLPH